MISISAQKDGCGEFELLVCNFNQWQPTEERWTAMLEFIHDEVERKRVLDFIRPTREKTLRGRENPSARAALVGRRLMMEVVNQMLGVPFKAIEFARDANNKPYLANPHPSMPGFNFNLSHDGDFTVLLGSSEIPIGIDTMRPVLPSINQNITEFFKSMSICFTNFEWSNINRYGMSDKEKIEEFFRHWCLKESFIKTSGIGLSMDLQRMEFSISRDKKSAQLKVDGQACPDFQFLLFDLLPGGHQSNPQIQNHHILSICLESKDKSLPDHLTSIFNHSIQFLEF